MIHNVHLSLEDYNVNFSFINYIFKQRIEDLIKFLKIVSKPFIFRLDFVLKRKFRIKLKETELEKPIEHGHTHGQLAERGPIN